MKQILISVVVSMSFFYSRYKFHLLKGNFMRTKISICDETYTEERYANENIRNHVFIILCKKSCFQRENALS